MGRYRYELVHSMHTFQNDDVLDNGGVLSESQVYTLEASDFAQRALLYLVSAGKYVCDKDYLVSRRSFPYFFLVCVDEGCLFVHYEGEDFTVRAGELLLMDCTRPHSYRAEDLVRLRYFNFRGANTRAYYQLLTDGKPMVHRSRRSVVLDSAVDQILVLAAQETPPEHEISVQLHRVLAVLAEHEEEPKQNAAVAAAIEYMQQHMQETLSIGAVADYVNLSEYYFSRLFRRHTGCAPHAYLVQLRIAQARQMLLSSGGSIDDIAEGCGFHSTTNFIRSFRNHVGCTPKQYRRAVGAEKNGGKPIDKNELTHYTGFR